MQSRDRFSAGTGLSGHSLAMKGGGSKHAFIGQKCDTSVASESLGVETEVHVVPHLDILEEKLEEI